MSDWKKIEAVRQIRKDFMVEVLVEGKWYLGYQVEWASKHTMGHTDPVGELVRIPN